jgi:hypothetical protein
LERRNQIFGAATFPPIGSPVRTRRDQAAINTLETIADDPLAEHVAKRGPGFMTVEGRTMKLRE